MSTPQQRKQQASIAALWLHATHDSTALTAAARAASETALNRRLLERVDPDNTLPEAERARRLKLARSAHFKALARIRQSRQ